MSGKRSTIDTYSSTNQGKICRYHIFRFISVEGGGWGEGGGGSDATYAGSYQQWIRQISTAQHMAAFLFIAMFKTDVKASHSATVCRLNRSWPFSRHVPFRSSQFDSFRCQLEPVWWQWTDQLLQETGYFTYWIIACIHSHTDTPTYPHTRAHGHKPQIPQNFTNFVCLPLPPPPPHTHTHTLALQLHFFCNMASLETSLMKIRRHSHFFFSHS